MKKSLMDINKNNPGIHPEDQKANITFRCIHARSLKKKHTMHRN